MKLETLVWNEFTGRTIIAIITTFVIYSVTNIWLTWIIVVLMIIWMLNPLFEYKMYGGN